MARNEEEIRKVVDRLDIEEIIKEAQRMGIKVRESTGKGHTIIENGKEVPLDLNRHFRIP